MKDTSLNKLKRKPFRCEDCGCIWRVSKDVVEFFPQNMAPHNPCRKCLREALNLSKPEPVKKGK